MNLNTLARQLGNILLQNKQQLVTAESCTAGGLAYAITAISGSSHWFERGIVTYSNSAKQEMLGVTQTMLDQHGAVSAETAQAMAEGALKHSHATISLAITGIAGPEGGSLEKPVGLVWFACARKNLNTEIISQHFAGNRQNIREQAIIFALEMLIAQSAVS